MARNEIDPASAAKGVFLIMVVIIIGYLVGHARKENAPDWLPGSTPSVSPTATR